MYITLETEYAVRIIDTLARSKKIINAQAISETSDVTLRFTLKILSKLVKKELVTSFKGANGGYRLDKLPKEISLGDVLEAIEGEYVFSRCLENGHVCPRNVDRTSCSYHTFYSGLTEKIYDELKKATFDRLVTEDNPCEVI